jgi:hypothetical protein
MLEHLQFDLHVKLASLLLSLLSTQHRLGHHCEVPQDMQPGPSGVLLSRRSHCQHAYPAVCQRHHQYRDWKQEPFLMQPLLAWYGLRQKIKVVAIFPE